MRQYAHDYVWGCQDRREIATAPGEATLRRLIEALRRAVAAVRAAGARRRNRPASSL
ncbi:MAG TPA: hypothetical protein VJ994_02175 [Paracoccaceae bacterium]|nr:hypothetical protein [Paracoccaceae bacterium]